mmetsp:Transcript_7705/g.31885  ORF Transcript_7705/g.31885 Transcript_7705/m.31885 type:complete len:238 (+) Transcript_7705:839-1552(+)
MSHQPRGRSYREYCCRSCQEGAPRPGRASSKLGASPRGGLAAWFTCGGRPAPPPAARWRLSSARPAVSRAFMTSPSARSRSFGATTVSAPDVRLRQTVHEPLAPNRRLRSPAGTTCISSRQNASPHQSPHRNDLSPARKRSSQSVRWANSSGTVTAHSERCHQFLSGRWWTMNATKSATGRILRRPQLRYMFQPAARTRVNELAVLGMRRMWHCRSSVWSSSRVAIHAPACGFTIVT